MERNDVLAAFQEALSTPEEIAKDLRVHKSWIYARTRETGPRSIPRVMVGKYLRFRLDNVDGSNFNIDNIVLHVIPIATRNE